MTIAAATYVNSETGALIACLQYRVPQAEGGTVCPQVPGQSFVCRACRTPFIGSPPTECPACGHLYVDPVAQRARR